MTVTNNEMTKLQKFMATPENRIKYALDAIARRAEVAARKQAALDELLAEIQG